MKRTKTKIEGDISLVPNSLPEDRLKQLKVRWNGTSYLEKFKNLIVDIIGREIDDTELLFEVIVCSPGYPNWFTQGWPVRASFTKYLPQKELENLKEGKILILKGKFGEIRLTAKQQGDKKFEEVYNELLRKRENAIS